VSRRFAWWWGRGAGTPPAVTGETPPVIPAGAITWNGRFVKWNDLFVRINPVPDRALEWNGQPVTWEDQHLVWEE